MLHFGRRRDSVNAGRVLSGVQKEKKHASGSRGPHISDHEEGHLRHHAHKDTTSLEPQFRSTKDSYVSTASRSDARGRKEPIELILSFHVLYLLVITRSFFILVLVGCF
ncbi:hypothetical protein GW17_00042792 [Ensete ventricosum]|nr:hypothetical protein GW17_00042792 [Ensete ventricosum]